MEPKTLTSFLIFFLLQHPCIPYPVPEIGDCVPQRCGHVTNITYPFWVFSQQPEYCGVPEFKLHCEEDGSNPSLQTPNGVYLVCSIFYASQSIRVAPRLPATSNADCPRYGNLTFTTTPFSVSPTNMEMFLLYNCTKPPDGSYRIPCDLYESFSFLGGNNSFPESAPCEVAVVPVLGFPGAKASDYHTLIKDGFTLDWTATDCTDCTASGGQCGYNNRTESFMCICNDGRTYSRSCIPAGRRVMMKIAIGVGILGILTVTLIVFLYLCRARVSQQIFFWEIWKRSPYSVDSFLEKYGSIAPKRYKYSDVKKMTKTFTTKLGSGGYGVVYKGEIHNSRPVAVKLLNSSKGVGDEFVNEVASIGRTSHVNVVSLLGYCYEGSKRALIYEFMPNGSLEKFIYTERSVTTTPLGWERLFNIAVGIARGLEYLHRGCSTSILHFDIKPHNILLDQEFNPKISDFGLAKLCPPQRGAISMSGARGTVGYIAPEVFSRYFGFVSSKSDVYSYGMMVLEIVGGRKNENTGVNNTSEIYFPHWIYEHFDRDGDLELCGVTNEHEEVARKMILVGLWCIQIAPENRPSMSRVLEMLEGSISSLQMPPKPYLFSPVRPSASSVSVTLS